LINTEKKEEKNGYKYYVGNKVVEKTKRLLQYRRRQNKIRRRKY